jgi:hypothetical protein
VQLSWVTTRGDEQLGQVCGMSGIWGTPMPAILPSIFVFVKIFDKRQNILVNHKFILFWSQEMSEAVF